MTRELTVVASGCMDGEWIRTAGPASARSNLWHLRVI
jgi:hypothetical protein